MKKTLIVLMILFSTIACKKKDNHPSNITKVPSITAETTLEEIGLKNLYKGIDSIQEHIDFRDYEDKYTENSLKYDIETFFYSSGNEKKVIIKDNLEPQQKIEISYLDKSTTNEIYGTFNNIFLKRNEILYPGSILDSFALNNINDLISFDKNGYLSNINYSVYNKKVDNKSFEYSNSGLLLAVKNTEDGSKKISNTNYIYDSNKRLTEIHQYSFSSVPEKSLSKLYELTYNNSGKINKISIKRKNRFNDLESEEIYSFDYFKNGNLKKIQNFQFNTYYSPIEQQELQDNKLVFTKIYNELGDLISETYLGNRIPTSIKHEYNKNTYTKTIDTPVYKIVLTKDVTFKNNILDTLIENTKIYEKIDNELYLSNEITRNKIVIRK